MYNKTTWNTGDIVTAEKLNKLEDGVANGNNWVFLYARMQLEYDVPSGEQGTMSAYQFYVWGDDNYEHPYEISKADVMFFTAFAFSMAKDIRIQDVYITPFADENEYAEANMVFINDSNSTISAYGDYSYMTIVALNPTLVESQINSEQEA